MNSNSRRNFLRLSVLAGGGVLSIGHENKAGASDAVPGAIHEPARSVPVFTEADVCVLGGSCTGVFAAIRAARLGAKVILIEKQNSFG
ncbi:MAG: FAD-dependent oxidoreductase, partial [Phycisphaerales bacterium]